MSGLFEHLAAQDDTHRVAQRKATAVANKRVKDRFGAFMANATDEDRAARLALVEDDITQVVAEVTEEYGGNAQQIEAAIKRTLSGGAEHLKEFQFGKGDKDDDSDDKPDDSDSDDDSDDDDSKPDFGSDNPDKSKEDDDDDDDSKESRVANPQHWDPDGPPLDVHPGAEKTLGNEINEGDRVGTYDGPGVVVAKNPSSMYQPGVFTHGATGEELQNGYDGFEYVVQLDNGEEGRFDRTRLDHLGDTVWGKQGSKDYPEELEHEQHDGESEECSDCGRRAGTKAGSDGIVRCESCAKSAESASPRSSTVKEARRPKMCPYHSEVVDVSLGSGDPQAGYNALASHAWGDKHCKGDFRGTCNFRPQMVTQKFWDDKKEEYAERARQRVEQDIAPDLGIETEPVMTQEPLETKPGEGITDIDGEMAEAPSAVGGAELEPAMAGHTAGTELCKNCGKHLPNDTGTYCPECGETRPGVGTANDLSKKTGADAPKGAGGAVTRESLPKANESGQGGPSPKIDKGNSGDENGWTLDDIDTEETNSPHPTVTQDAEDTAKYDKAEFTDQTDAVTTDQDLPTADESGQSTERNVEQPATDTWNGTEGLANPVASVDPDKNPLREIAESEFDGFMPSTQVQAAIQQHEQQS